jgi:hypothetical protein
LGIWLLNTRTGATVDKCVSYTGNILHAKLSRSGKYVLLAVGHSRDNVACIFDAFAPAITV